MPEEKIWSVSEVNSSVKDVIEGAFQPFWMEGEIGTLNIYRSGHVYMTLKDKDSQIRAAFFGGAESARRLGLQVGTRIEAFGRLSVYAVKGEYQFTLSQMRLRGIGDLFRRFEEIKAKLKAEGLFDESRKKKIPLLPCRIGIVTSPDGAAIRDFLHIVERRFPNLHIRIYPAPVQGKGAEEKLAAGIKHFNDNPFADVIILTRGGGSMEDLWAFNEEILARAIATSSIPVISAVGHEIDYTIADFVADLRVPTPSAAAELVIGREEDFKNFIAESRRRLKGAFDISIERIKSRLAKFATRFVFREPLYMLREKQQLIDEMSDRMKTAVLFSSEKRNSELNLLSAKLQALNPTNVLSRGYSILRRKDSGELVMDPSVPEGTAIEGILAKGRIDLMVTR